MKPTARVTLLPVVIKWRDDKCTLSTSAGKRVSLAIEALLTSETREEERLREVFSIAKCIRRQINPRDKDEIGSFAEVGSFTVLNTGVNCSRVLGYSYVQLCSF